MLAIIVCGALAMSLCFRFFEPGLAAAGGAETGVGARPATTFATKRLPANLLASKFHCATFAASWGAIGDQACLLIHTSAALDSANCRMTPLSSGLMSESRNG